MTRKEKFIEDWESRFGGQLPLPELKFLEQKLIVDSGTEHSSEDNGNPDKHSTNCTKNISTGFELLATLEDDLRKTKDNLIRLRVELKAAKFCQDWLLKEIKRCRKVSEGLESIASDDFVSGLTDDEELGSIGQSPDEASLGSQSGDSAIYSTQTDLGEKPESPSNDGPPLPMRRPSEIERDERAGITKFNIRDAPEPESDSDSDSDDYERIYENIALLQEKIKERSKPEAIPDRARDHLTHVAESGSDESPSCSPVPTSFLLSGENEDDFETSFRSPASRNTEPSSDNRKSITETEIDAVSPETDVDNVSSSDGKGLQPPVTVARSNTWKQMNQESLTVTDGSGRAPSPVPQERKLKPKQSGSSAAQDDTLKPGGPPAPLQRRLTSPDVERLNIRRAVLGTILEGEKKFIAGLEELEKISDSFRANLTTSSACLTKHEFDTLFFRIPELCDVHKSFKELLEPKLVNWSPEEAIGDCFRYLASKFFIHEEYAANYMRASQVLFNDLKQEKEEFRNVAVNIRGKLPNGESLTLEALLHSPLHRIIKLTLTISDLLKHTPESHQDHRVLIYVLEKTNTFITQVTEAVSTHSIKKRSCQKHDYVVEWAEGERKLRYLFLWSDVLICANKRASGGVFSRDRGQFDCQWYLPLTELSLIPTEHCEGSSKQQPSIETKKVDEIKKKLADLNTQLKRDMVAKQSRHVQREIEKKRKRIAQLEAQLTILSPALPLHLYHHNGKTYTLLLQSDYEKSDWREAILAAKRECRVAPNLTLYHINRLLSKFKQGRQASVRSIVVSQDADLVTGTLHVTIVKAVGLTIPSELYCCIEVDAYGIFFLMAKTKKSPNTMAPVWNEDFDLEVDGAKTLRVICYDHTKGLEDEMIDKGQAVLTKEFLKNKQEFEIKMERLTVTLKIGFQSSAKTLKRVQSRKKVGVFGVPVSTLTKRECSDMPQIVKTCITEVEKRGMSELGIYRISGSIADINRLKRAFETGHKSVTKLVENIDIHAVAGLLKLYLRELPEPLFTHALYDKLTSALTLSDAESKKKYMMSLLKSMPEPNRTTVIALFNHLRKIASNEVQNKMSLHNISTVFGPTLLSPADDGEQDPNDVSGYYSMAGALAQVGVLHYYLEHFSEKALNMIDSDRGVTI